MMTKEELDLLSREIFIKSFIQGNFDKILKVYIESTCKYMLKIDNIDDLMKYSHELEFMKAFKKGFKVESVLVNVKLKEENMNDR